MVEYLAAIKSAMDTWQSVKDAFDNSDKSVDIELGLVKLQKELLQAEIDAMQASKKIIQLEDELAVKKSMLYNENLGVYFNSDEENDNTAYCQRCFDDKGKAIHLHSVNPQFGSGYKCKVCEGYFPS